MSDLAPKKLVIDDSPEGNKKKDLREGTCGELNENQKKYVDHFVDKRDEKGDELVEAEQEIDSAIRSANRNKDIVAPGEEIPIEIDIEFETAFYPNVDTIEET